MTKKQLEGLSKAELIDRCWVADINSDEAQQSSAEAWARIGNLLEILENEEKTEAVRLYIKLKAHQKHVTECQVGSCEDEFNSLVAAGLVSPSIAKKITARRNE